MAAQEVIKTLRILASGNAGVLQPEAVVEAARPDDSPLHSSFTWDDTEAAHQYRLWQARVLIRSIVQYIDVGGEEKEFRVFTSLSSDRTGNGGGYRETVAVLSDNKYHNQLLADAHDEMIRFNAKYASLKELAGVIGEIKKVLRETA